MPVNFLLAKVMPAAYVLIATVLFSCFVAYRWVTKNSTKKAGCLTIGIAAVIVNFILLFPVTISLSFLENGSLPLKTGVGIFWIIVISTALYITRSKNYKLLWRIVIKIFVVIFGGLFLVLYGGMVYFIYLRFFTHQKDDAPAWAVMICITFVAVLTLAVVGFFIKDKNAIKAAETDYKNIDQADLNAEFVYSLDLSNQNLTKLPGEVLKYKNLKTLNLSNNQITELPAEIRFLKQLSTLILSNNPINDQQRANIRKLFSLEVDVIFRS